MGKETKKAIAYLRTSSRTNVGADKDSDKRQRAAIEAYAKAAGYEIVETFYDAAVSGGDPVGTPSRLCRDAGAPVEQWRADDHRREPGPLRSRPHGAASGPRYAQGEGNFLLVAASAPTHFIEDTPTAVLVRQVLGAVAEFENTNFCRQAGGRTQAQARGHWREGRGA